MNSRFIYIQIFQIISIKLAWEYLILNIICGKVIATKEQSLSKKLLCLTFIYYAKPNTSLCIVSCMINNKVFQSLVSFNQCTEINYISVKYKKIQMCVTLISHIFKLTW